jgi:hypothetical protein
VQIAAVKNDEQKKSTATSGKLITAVYASYGYVYIFVQGSPVGWRKIPYCAGGGGGEG